MSAFWRAYFGAFCASLVLFGAVLCAGAFAPTSGPVSLLIKTLSGGNAANFEPALRFSLGLMGALTIGWAVMIYGVMCGWPSHWARRADRYGTRLPLA